MIFNVGRETNIIKENEAIVSRVSTIKNIDNLLEISTQGFSNESAINKNKEILLFIQKSINIKLMNLNI